jgi:cysteine desulfurase
MIYLDANASEPLRPEARAAAVAALDLAGNPSSVHKAGRRAWEVLENARKNIAVRFGAAATDTIFTSGGTESNALAITAYGHGRMVIAGATEHDAVRAAVAAFGPLILPVTATGQADLAALHTLLCQSGPALVCLMLANNETGILHPIADAAAICRRHGAILHVDAIQGAGRLPFTLASLGASSLAISSHKVGGPKGAGALLLAPDAPPLAPLIQGGGQERGRRGGTPALPAIAGMEAALGAAAVPPTHFATLRDRIESAAAGAGAIICGAGEKLPNTTCLAFPGLRADMQVISLDLAGFAVSAGAACSSGKVSRSHVLDAMGLGDLAGCAIRVSLPWTATEPDIEAFITAYLAMVRKQQAA